MIEFLIDLDIKLFNFFNSKISNPIFDLIFPVITDQNFWTLPMLGLIIYLFIARGKVGKISVLLLLIAVGLSDFVSASILKPYFERLRPSHSELEGLILLVNKGGKYGFVSSHAANIFAASTILSFFYIHKKKTMSYNCFFSFLQSSICGSTFSWRRYFWRNARLFNCNYNNNVLFKICFK